MGERYSEQSEAGAAAPSGLRLLCAIERPDTLALVRETLRSALPSSTIEVASAVLPGGRLPIADCVILDAYLGGTPGIEAARALRAAGYEGGIVLLESAAEAQSARALDPEERLAERAAVRTSGPVSMRLAAIGVSRTVAYESLVGELPTAVLGACVATADPALEAARRELRAAQRLNAMGDLAATVQHAANNPLTALMAEAQLLELEPLAPEHREAVQRIIELSRRLAATIRQLDLPRAR